ncbi:MAG: type II toxin-antitoxin system HipA family toxin [Terracidiphilus sp.]
MAELLYGYVYFKDRLAGTISQESGERCSFIYDAEFLSRRAEAISITLPLRSEPYVYQGRLHPFFDNLLAEGREAMVQARWLGVPVEDRFARLLAFGEDCIGAVSVRDPKPRAATGEPPEDPAELAALNSRASISGVQSKLLVVETEDGFRPARAGELSTHIAKVPSGNHPQIVPLEFLTTEAARELLPDDEIVQVQIAPIPRIVDEALMVRRFDRPVKHGAIGKRHFEEFNQILNQIGDDKYKGNYGDMARVLRENPRCALFDVDRLFRRILVCILLGNNDAHLKNFALLYDEDQLRLSPFYDLLAVAFYEDYSQTGMALKLGPGTNPTTLAGIGAVHLRALATSFSLREAALREAVHDLGRRMARAEETIRNAAHGTTELRNQLADYVRKRWNGTFNPIIDSTGRRS